MRKFPQSDSSNFGRTFHPHSTLHSRLVSDQPIAVATSAAMAVRRLPRSGFFAQSFTRRQISLPIRSPIQLARHRDFGNTTTPVEANNPTPDLPSNTPQPTAAISSSSTPLTFQPPRSAISRSHTPRYSLDRAPLQPQPLADCETPSSHSPEFLAQLTALAVQAPHYITIHIHGKPYLVTAGDTIRLPFLMHGVMPGDVLRLDRATIIGSREWTLRGGSRSRSAETREDNTAAPIVGRTDDMHQSLTQQVPSPGTSSQLRHSRPKSQNRLGYIDPSLFVCRATVLGTESEPLRTKEKTKRRQRHVRHVRSKHRYTILRIREVHVNVPGSEAEAA